MNLEELRKLKEKAQSELKVRAESAKIKIIVGMGTCGIAAGARPVMQAFLEEVERRNLKDVLITQSGCKGICAMEPVVDVEIEGEKSITYGYMTPEKAKKVISEHIVNGTPVSEYIVSTQG